MDEQKPQPRFRFSIIVIALLVVLLIVLLVTNNSYSGKYLYGGASEMAKLISGQHVNEEGNQETLSEVYYKDDTIYFLLKDSKFKGSFPKNADYYIHYQALKL